MRQVRVEVRGRVQGVGYRAWVVSQARRRAIAGWVRNRSDGSVEALFAGEEAEIDSMLALCAEGPPLARVTEVHRFDDGGSVEPGFHQRPTL